MDTLESDPARFGATIEEKDGIKTLIMNGRRRSSLNRERFDLDLRLTDMDKAGIEVQVLSPTPSFMVCRDDDSWAAELATLMNDGIAGMVAESPRFWGIGHLPLQSTELSLKELDHVRDLGLKGIMVGASVEGVDLDEERLEPVWARLNELEMTVFVHPTNPKFRERMEPYHLTNLLANPLDTSIALSRLMLGGVILRNPNIRFYFAHGGGFIPYQFGRIDHAFGVREDTSSVIDVLPSTLLKRVWFDTITHATPSLRYLIEIVGDTNVVVGTDYPADMGDMRIAEKLDALGLSDESRSRIEHENAEQLFAASTVAA
jgi:aminocarboxymuconate-semialdehyde decarboxylase